MIVAITGGIGGGKSYVCRLLGERGIRVYDCDAAAKRLMRTSRTLQEQLSSLVGVDLFPDGQLQKPLLRQYLLQSRDHGRAIDDIVHPAVAEDFLRSGAQWLLDKSLQQNVDLWRERNDPVVHNLEITFSTHHVLWQLP